MKALLGIVTLSLCLAACGPIEVGLVATPTAPATALVEPVVQTATARTAAVTATSTRTPTVAATSTGTPSVTATSIGTPSVTATSIGTPTSPALPSTTTPPPTLTPSAPAIIRFTIEPARLNPGEPITLAWETSGDSVTISALDSLGRWGPTIYTGSPSGTLVITTSIEARNTVTYIVTAGLGEQYAWRAATATLNCPDTWFFPNPPADCPWPAHFTEMQAQRFEHGLMLWTQWNDAIYILYDRPHWYRWDRLANEWFAGMPESDPSIIPPAGLYQPVRGFGMAWRMGYVSPTQVVRGIVGWATEEEFAVPNAAFQCDTKPKYASCYITGPEGVYVLGPERTGGGLWVGPTPGP